MTAQPEQIHHKEVSFWIKWILVLLAFILLGAIIATSLAGLISKMTNVEIGVFNLQGLPEHEIARIAWVYRSVIFFQHLFMFIFPAVMTMILFKRNVGSSLFHFSPRINANAAVCGIFILMAAYPLVQFGAEMNKMIPLPSVFKDMEEQSLQLVKLMLTTDSIMVLIVNVILVALVPAIGEELVFRGFLQHLMSKLIAHPHINVWVTAIVFSAIHMQFEGFFPRMILGLVLGYLMLWSGNIIYPMIAHFFNNALQVIIQFIVREDMSGFDNLENYNAPLWLLIISVLLLMLSTSYFKSFFNKTEKVLT